MFSWPCSLGGKKPYPCKDGLTGNCSEQRARKRSDADPLTVPMTREGPGEQDAVEGSRSGAATRALTVDEAVFLGQEGGLQAFPAAHRPAKQHPWGERGIGSMAGLDVGQSWNERRAG